MKNLRKLSREELKNLAGGRVAPISECGGSTWCINGSVWINLGSDLGGNKEYCCS
jgi:hypothetical protein